MKKKLFFAALAIAALVSCSESDYLGDERPSPVSSGSEVAIGFGSGFKAVTRADDVTGAAAADSLGSNFVVYGVKSDGAPFGTSAVCDTVFDHYNVNWVESTANTTTSNTADWEYVGQTKHTYGPAGDQTIKYWDYGKKQYDFIAYSLGKSSGLTVTEINVENANGYPANATFANITDGAYKITGTTANLAKAYIADLVTVYRDGENDKDGLGTFGKEVEIRFRSLSAKVRIGLYEIVPGYSVKDVVFYSDATTADETNLKAYLYTDNNVFNSKGSYIVYFPKTGKTNLTNTDYNKAHLKFVAAADNAPVANMEFGVMDNATLVAKEKQESSSTEAMYIGRASNEASYPGLNTVAGKEHHYTSVIPNETGAVLNLKVDYTLVSTDGSLETIQVTGATAQVPAVYAQWKSGYAYTYLFKISQNSNGNTNPEVGPAGLYPITFDAVVVDNEVDGVQETITTVAEPSITTYSKGIIVTNNNEYTTGSNIYVTVRDEVTAGEGKIDAPLNSGNAKLYTVTLSDEGAAQTINEASVANALAQGGTVEDANGVTMTVSEVASGTLTYPGKIAAADAPDGNEITVPCALFTAGAAGTIYVFEYIKNPRVDETPAVLYTAETAAEHNAQITQVNEGDPVPADYEEKVGNAAESDTLTAAEATAYNAKLLVSEGDVMTPAVAGSAGEYGYKIIKIKE